MRKVAVLVMMRSRTHSRRRGKVNDKTTGGEDVMGLRILCFGEINLYGN